MASAVMAYPKALADDLRLHLVPVDEDGDGSGPASSRRPGVLLHGARWHLHHRLRRTARSTPTSATARMDPVQTRSASARAGTRRGCRSRSASVRLAARVLCPLPGSAGTIEALDGPPARRRLHRPEAWAEAYIPGAG